MSKKAPSNLFWFYRFTCMGDVVLVDVKTRKMYVVRRDRGMIRMMKHDSAIPAALERNGVEVERYSYEVTWPEGTYTVHAEPNLPSSTNTVLRGFQGPYKFKYPSQYSAERKYWYGRPISLTDDEVFELSWYWEPSRGKVEIDPTQYTGVEVDIPELQ